MFLLRSSFLFKENLEDNYDCKQGESLVFHFSIILNREVFPVVFLVFISEGKALDNISFDQNLILTLLSKYWDVKNKMNTRKKNIISKHQGWGFLALFCRVFPEQMVLPNSSIA